ncbi:hypothetical protein [Staphylococcus aureus]
MGGIDYSYIFKNSNLFGEYAMSFNGGKAFCQGLICEDDPKPVSYTHLRAHETLSDLVCRLLLEKNLHHL